MTDRQDEIDDREFDDASISRRTFARLTAATGAALALPSNATASLDSDPFESEYQYVLTHTPNEYAVPTLVQFSDPSGFDALKDIASENVVTTTETSRPAAYTELTAAEAAVAVEIPTAEDFSHSPGANPFWRTGEYPLGVFPEATRSTDYIDFDENVAGLEHLESQYPNRMNVFSIGTGHGKYNYVSDRRDPREVMVAEITDDVDDEAAFREKTKVLVECSVHGDERAGTEAGSRFVENLLRGEEPETEVLLDDVVLVFVYLNPDGWTARRPQYESYGVPGATLHERGNAGGDTNRQYPIPGWIDPAHRPAEPLGATLDGESLPPDEIVELVPDSLAFVEHCREYENLTHGVDLHGMLSSEYFMLGLESHVQSTNREHHDLAEMNRRIDEAASEELEEIELSGDIQDALGVNTGVVPEEPYDYSPSWEGIGYTGTGYIKDFMSQPERWGCLDMTMMTMEMAYSNIVGGNVYDPARVDMQVRGYRTAIREITAHAAAELETEIETGGETLGYVTTDELTRSADDLELDEGTTFVSRDEYSLDVDENAEAAVAFELEEGLHSASIHPHAEPPNDHPGAGLVDVALVDPDGAVVRDFEVVSADRVGGECCGMVSWNVADPQPGKWTLVFANPFDAPTAITARVTAMGMEGGGSHPDPVDVLGYHQREYEATPFRYFEDLEDDLETAPIEYGVEEVAAGEVEADHLVVIHDDGLEDNAYLAALDEFVSDGGNLVLTDTAINLLPELESDLASGIDRADIENRARYYREPARSDDADGYYVAHLAEKNDDHPLLAGARDSQQLLWHVAGLGYSTNKAPMTLVAPNAFADLETGVASVAGTTSDRVSAGSRTRTADDPAGIHVIGSLLPPAHQEEIHPFGMTSYGVTFFGHLVLMNAVGFRQIRRLDGDVVEEYGWEGFEVEEEEPLGAEFERDGDGSVYSAGQTRRQTVRAENNEVERVADADRISDVVSAEWTVDEEYGDAAAVEDHEDGQRVVFEESADGEFTYFAEAPDGIGSTGRYEFGAVELERGGEWKPVPDTTESVSVVGVDLCRVPIDGCPSSG